MKTFSIEDIRSWDPCYDPAVHLSEGWTGTAIDVLKHETIPFADKIWCVLRTELVSERVMRLFAVWSYRQTLQFVTNPDSRSVECANVAERFANNEATEEEMLAAWSSAESAWLAAESSARSAWSAAESAAESARSAQCNKLIEMIEAEDK